MDRWENQVAVVTGASAGIGAAIVEELVERGLKVVGIARGEAKLKEFQKQLEGKKGKFYYVVGDVAKEEDIVKAFKWIKENVGVVHILVNNAGISSLATFMDMSSEHIKSILDTNVFALCIATREALNQMENNKIAGHIIHINSGLGHKVVRGLSFHIYSASKHAVTALTESLRNELSLRESKTKVSSISPGVVRTKYVESALNESTDAKIIDEAERKRKEHLKTAPFLYPKDIADAVVFVLSTPPHVQVHELMIAPVGAA